MNSTAVADDRSVGRRINMGGCHGERLDQLLESTLANRFVTRWRITIMLVAEGHRFRQEINTLASGSPSRFLRILSYGLANHRTNKPTSFHTSGAMHVDHSAMRAAALGPQNEPAAREDASG